MANRWQGLSAEFDGLRSGVNKTKRPSPTNNTTIINKMNRSKYTPLKIETTPVKKPLVTETKPKNYQRNDAAGQTSAMTTFRKPASSVANVGSTSVHTPGPTAVQIPEPSSIGSSALPSTALEEEDWGDDDLDLDFSKLDFPELEPVRSVCNEITDKELQELTMALYNDDSFDMDAPMAPISPSKARLNQTTAVFAPCGETFSDDGPVPSDVIHTLREENKRLLAELKQQRKTAATEQRIKLEEKQKEMDAERKATKNRESDLRREMEKLSRNAKALENELRKEVEVNKRKIEAAQKLTNTAPSPAPLPPQPGIRQREPNDEVEQVKRRKLCNGASLLVKPEKESKLCSEICPEETNRKEPTKLVPKKSVSESMQRLLNLPSADFFLEEFSSISSADAGGLNRVLINSRHKRDTRDDWGRMLDISADQISQTCGLDCNSNESILPEIVDLSESRVSSNPSSPSTSLDTLLVSRELTNIVHMIDFSGTNFKSKEMERILETCVAVFRCMLDTSKFSNLEAVTNVLISLWLYELPEVSQLQQFIELFKQILTTFQVSTQNQLTQCDRTAVFNLFQMLFREQDLQTVVCSKSNVCFLQHILREIEAGCYKLKLIYDTKDLFDPTELQKEYRFRSSENRGDWSGEDLSDNYQIVIHMAELLARFIEQSIKAETPSPWLDAGCIDCCCSLLSCLVAVLFSLVTIYLDRTSNLDKGSELQVLTRENIVKPLEQTVKLLYQMKMEVTRYKDNRPLPWIKIVERISSEYKKRYVWSLEIMQFLVGESCKTILQKLVMECAN